MLIEENCDEHSSRKSLRRLAEETRVEVSGFKFSLFPNRNFKAFVDICKGAGNVFIKNGPFLAHAVIRIDFICVWLMGMSIALRVRTRSDRVDACTMCSCSSTGRKNCGRFSNNLRVLFTTPGKNPLWLAHRIYF